MSPLCVCEEGIFIGAGCQLVRLTQTQNGFEQWTQVRLLIIINPQTAGKDARLSFSKS